MLRRGGNETDALDLGFLPPVQLANFGRRNPPLDQQVANAHRRQKMLGPIGQLAYRLFIEVIIVIMRKDHCGQRRKLFKFEWWLVKALGAGPLHRRGAFGKYRVGDEEALVQFQQYRGVPQAPQAAIRRFEQLLTAQRLHGNLYIRSGSRRLAKEQELEADAQFFKHAVLRQCPLVVVSPILALRRFTGLGEQRGHE
ncbi:hypothetical protein D3C81_1092000 [compost metagenome]